MVGQRITGAGSLFLLLVMLSVNTRAQTNSRQQIELHYQRAEQALATNRPEAAATEFREILKLDPANAEARANLGVIAYKKGSYSEAAQLFTETLKLKPALWDAKAFLGLSEIQLNHVSVGEPLIEESFPYIKNPALQIDAGVTIVRFHQAAKSLGEVLNVVHDLERQHPNDPEVLYIAYRAYSELAAADVKALSQRAPGSAQLHQILAQAAMTQDNFPGAIAQYRKAIDADPHLPGVHYELGRAILTNSQDETARQQAEHEFEVELTSSPTDFNSEYELGEVFRLGSNLQMAEKHYVRALELNPKLVEAQLALGGVLITLGRPGEAIEHFVDATYIDPDNENAHYRLARAYRQAGRLEDANREMERFQQLRQTHGSSSSNNPVDEKDQ